MPNENDGGTPTTTPVANDQLYGCDFDIETAKALNGKSIVAMVTNQTGTKMVAIAGPAGAFLQHEFRDHGSRHEGRLQRRLGLEVPRLQVLGRIP